MIKRNLKNWARLINLPKRTFKLKLLIKLFQNHNLDCKMMQLRQSQLMCSLSLKLSKLRQKFQISHEISVLSVKFQRNKLPEIEEPLETLRLVLSLLEELIEFLEKREFHQITQQTEFQWNSISIEILTPLITFRLLINRKGFQSMNGFRMKIHLPQKRSWSEQFREIRRMNINFKRQFIIWFKRLMTK